MTDKQAPDDLNSNTPSVREPFYSDGQFAFFWCDVIMIAKKPRSRASLIYLKQCAQPAHLDYTHDSLVRAWTLHTLSQAEGE